ncbi:MAG: hypothetical protein ACI4MJ_02265 [Aristaeellaceae bacterium]
MKRKILALCALLLCLTLAGGALADGSYWYYDGAYYTNTLTSPQTAQTSMRIASRSGPGTDYNELGSYFKKGYTVTVLSKAYDERNSIWWLQIELTYSSELRRMYTGLKRVDIDINDVQEEYPLYFATVTGNYTPYYGPGTNYTAHKLTVPAGTEGIVYALENGWAQLEYYDASKEQYRRVWLPMDRLAIGEQMTYFY